MTNPRHREPRGSGFPWAGALPDQWLPAVALGGLFLVLGTFSILITRASEGVAMIWPANAVVAALMIRMRRVNWPVAATSILVAGVLANRVAASDPWLLALGLTGVNLIEIAAMVVTFRVVFPLPYPRLSVPQAGFMILVMGILITGLGATLGGLLLQGATGAQFWPAMRNWWAADALGACLFATPVILYSRSAVDRLVRPGLAWKSALSVPICAVATWLAIRYVEFPFVLIALLPMIAAFQVGAFGTAVLSLGNAMVVVALWMAGIRPHGLEVQADNLLSGLPFIALIAMTMPPVAVALGTDARRRMALALQASELRFRESMEHSPLGMIILDRNGQWSYTNPALQQMLGYTREEFSAMDIESLAHPDEIHDVWQRWGRLIAQQEESYKTTRRFQHRDGRWIWVECAVSLARDEDGIPLHFVAHVESLQERREAEGRLAAERELLRTTLASIADAVITIDGNGLVTYMNAAAVGLTGRPFVLSAGRPLQEVLALQGQETGTGVADLLQRCAAQAVPVSRGEPCAMSRPDGSVRHVSESITPVFDDHRAVTGFVVVVHDVTESLERTRDLRHRANHDPLTNLLNRAAFERELHEAFARGRRDGQPATLIALDLDRFKAVNDSGGHAAGDAVLRHVAAMLKRSVRPTDLVGRIGGDEFVVLLNNCSQSLAHEVAQRLLTALNPLQTAWNGALHSTGASIGLALFSPDFATPDDWVRSADGACYEAKRAGRGVLRHSA